VKTASVSQVRVSLVDDQGDGDRFHSDICQMLERIAARSGTEVKSIAAVDLAVPRSRTYAFASEVPEGVLREAGAHRAQLVPGGSGVGRVMTSRVVIEVTPMAQPLSASRVVKTYNYVLGRVTRHESGEILNLGEVLAGLV
jgi:protein subunit release factor A